MARRDAIVASWLGEPDEPGAWEASHGALLVEGDRAVASGETRYAGGQAFWFMKHP